MHRVLMAMVKHESNTYNRFPTELRNFRVQSYRRDAEVIQAYGGARLEMSGFIHAAKVHGWSVETPLAVHANSGGRVTAEARQDFLNVLGDCLDRTPRFDGILLALHGAMVAMDEDDADGALLQFVRERVGPGVPIAVTLDLHANVSERMARLADIVVSYRTNPHVDHFETAERAAALLEGAMSGEINPRTVVARSATLVAFDRGRTHTGHGPMVDALRAAAEIERSRPDVYCISINAGFSHADVWEAGPSVTVTGEAGSHDLSEIACRLMDPGFERRAEETVRLLSVPEAIEAARSGRPGKPVVIADYTDAPGGGAYGDSTVLLRALMDSGLPSVFAAIWDPPAAAAAIEAGVGARLTLRIGGWIDPTFSGDPVEAEVEVLTVSEGDFVHESSYGAGTIGSFGPSALVRIGSLDCVVSTINRNILDPQQFRIFGIDPFAQAVVALKCMHGFRAGFEERAAAILACDAGGLTTYDYTRFDPVSLRRPIWPLDRIDADAT